MVVSDGGERKEKQSQGNASGPSFGLLHERKEKSVLDFQASFHTISF